MNPVPLPPVPAPVQLNAKVVAVTDGDSINVIVNPYKRHYVGSAEEPQPIRLLGCNAREKEMPGGPEARDHLAALLPPGTRIVLVTTDDDKFAPRWDCGVIYADPLGQSRDLVVDLVADNWAAPWNGRGTKPVPPWPRSIAPFAGRQERIRLARKAAFEWRAA